MSFYTALTGLKGAQTDISTTSNNIANVGSNGFKKSRAEFGDIYGSTPSAGQVGWCWHADKVDHSTIFAR